MAYINGNQTLFSPQMHIDGYEEGRKAEYEAWWDNYQQNGNRTDYDLAFGGHGWTIETFKPKHNIVPTTAYMMFRKCFMTIDLVEYLDKLNVNLDFSQCTGLLYTFSMCYFTRVGEIDGRSSGASVTFDNTFAYASKLHTIDKLYLSTTKPNFNNNSFNSCAALVNLTIEGTISNNGLNLQWSPKLSHDSILGIFSALSQDTNGLKVTFSRAAVDKAFETSEGANDGATNENSDWFGITTGFRENWIFELV